MRDIHLLGSREKALMNFKRRIPSAAVDDFVLVVLQSERYGTSMSDALHVLSETVRADQMTMLERTVLKLPAKISGIIMFFMMPSVLLMVLAPILLGGLSIE
jgi:tight adherence protein C